MKTAVFSNGHTDTYKGKRDVKAAWMVIYPNGMITSGHSLDRKSATSTAGSNISTNNPNGVIGLGSKWVSPVWMLKQAKTAGFDSLSAYRTATAKKCAEYRALCKIEIIELA